MVALKHLKLSLDEEGCPSLVTREIALLNHVKDHKNVVKLLDVHHFNDDSEKKGRLPSPQLWLVFELLDSDLRTMLKQR